MLRRLLPVLALIALAAPATAHAGTAKVETYQTCSSTLQCKAMVYDTRRAVNFQADPDEGNAVTISRSGNVVTVRDAGAPLTPGPGCKAVSANEATCDVDTTFAAAGAILGDENDTFDVTAPLGVPVSANGGDGADTITGGDEANSFDGGPGADVVRGAGGADRFVSLENDRNPDQYDGGPGRDLLDLSARTGRLSVNLAVAAGQGEAGEDDSARAMEDVTGGKASDVLRGNSASNAISGGEGNDRMFGAGGSDRLTGDSGRDSFSGGSGSDTIETTDRAAGAELVSCGAGRDTVGRTDEDGGLYGDEPEFFGPERDDVLRADCERALIATAAADARIVADPRLRRVSRAAVSLANPCRGRRGCTGRVTLQVGRARTTVGRARFNARARLVAVALAPGGERAMRRGDPLAITVRVAYASRSFAVSYRTRAAR